MAWNEMPKATQVPFCCPVCHGQGLVSHPPWVAGDQPGWCATNAHDLYPCRACAGTGVVWAVKGGDRAWQS